MKLLAVDTSTEACSAALSINGEIRQRYALAPREHSHLILKMIDELLDEASIPVRDLDRLAFGRGPGSFMGLRIAAGVVQGIAFAHDIPVIPVSTLAAISSVAIAESGSGSVLAAIDARMNEVYWGAYTSASSGEMLLVGEECVIAPGLIPVPDAGEWIAAGTGWSAYSEIMEPRVGGRLLHKIEQCFPSAEAIARLALIENVKGNVLPAAHAVPVYLRDNVASKPKPR